MGTSLALAIKSNFWFKKNVYDFVSCHILALKKAVLKLLSHWMTGIRINNGLLVM